jgi:hypothetical protein
MNNPVHVTLDDLKDVCDVCYDCTFYPRSPRRSNGSDPQCVAQFCVRGGGGAGQGLRGTPSETLKPLMREFDNGVLEKATQPKPQRTSRQTQLMKTFNTTVRDEGPKPSPNPASPPQQVAPSQAHDNTRAIAIAGVVMGTLAFLGCDCRSARSVTVNIRGADLENVLPR